MTEMIKAIRERLEKATASRARIQSSWFLRSVVTGYGSSSEERDFQFHAPEDIDHLLDELEKNKTVSCDCCGFRYGAEHKTQATGGYDCPVCEVARLEARVRELEVKLYAKEKLDEYCDQCGKRGYHTILCPTHNIPLSPEDAIRRGRGE